MCARRPTQGFTLLELMIVVVIVGLVMAAAGPAFNEALADQGHAFAARDVARLGKQAFNEATGRRRAYVISFTQMNGNNNGLVQLIRGDGNLCSQNWVAQAAIGAFGTANSRIIDQLLLGSGDYSKGVENQVRVRESSGLASVAFCYTNTGALQVAQGLAGPFITSNNVPPAVGAAATAFGAGLGGGYIFQISRQSGGVVKGVTRNVFYPLGGMPRAR